MSSCHQSRPRRLNSKHADRRRGLAESGQVGEQRPVLFPALLGIVDNQKDAALPDRQHGGLVEPGETGGPTFLAKSIGDLGGEAAFAGTAGPGQKRARGQ